MLNLSVLLEDSARKYPTRDALVLGDTRLTYAQVNAAANQVANLLVERGIKPGEKVALSCPNLPYFPIVYYGILKAGAVVVPLNVLLKGREVAYHLADAKSSGGTFLEGRPVHAKAVRVAAGATIRLGRNEEDSVTLVYHEEEPDSIPVDPAAPPAAAPPDFPPPARS